LRVQVIHEAIEGDPNEKNTWKLCFQYCLYVFDDGTSKNGYRFIWRRPDGSLQPARGQARILSINQAVTLLKMARAQGWGNYEVEN